MPVRTASAVWEGDLAHGKGTMQVGGLFEGKYSAGSRFQESAGTNPEELIGAAHAGCFSMAFSNILAGQGFTPKKVSTTAKVTIEKVGDGFTITTIDLITEGDVPGIDDAKFQKIAQEAKAGCPVSRALAGVKINLKAKLL